MLKSWGIKNERMWLRKGISCETREKERGEHREAMNVLQKRDENNKKRKHWGRVMKIAVIFGRPYHRIKCSDINTHPLNKTFKAINVFFFTLSLQVIFHMCETFTNYRYN